MRVGWRRLSKLNTTMKIQATELLIKYKNVLINSQVKIDERSKVILSHLTKMSVIFLVVMTLFIGLSKGRTGGDPFKIIMFNIFYGLIMWMLAYTHPLIPNFLIWNIITPLLTLPLVKISKDIENLIAKINNTIDLIQDMDEILDFLDHLQKILKFLTVYKFLFRFLVWVNIEDIFEETKIWVMWVLRDLKSDLNIQIMNQQSILKTAKSEVEIHIQWTTELKSVSELQKVRLDKQIEQFEELQRVLVKV